VEKTLVIRSVLDILLKNPDFSAHDADVIINLLLESGDVALPTPLTGYHSRTQIIRRYLQKELSHLPPWYKDVILALVVVHYSQGVEALRDYALYLASTPDAPHKDIPASWVLQFLQYPVIDCE
jgi:hypothetical protein